MHPLFGSRKPSRNPILALPSILPSKNQSTFGRQNESNHALAYQSLSGEIREYFYLLQKLAGDCVEAELVPSPVVEARPLFSTSILLIAVLRSPLENHRPEFIRDRR